MRPLFKIVLILIGLSLPTSGWAQKIIYVNAAHIGSEDGSQIAPFRTIQAALNRVNNRDEIHVAAGTYFENLDIDASHFGFKLMGGYEPYNWSRNIEGNPTVINGQSKLYCLDITNTSYITISGFRFTNAQHLIRMVDSFNVNIMLNRFFDSTVGSNNLSTSAIMMNYVRDITVQHNAIYNITGIGANGTAILVNASANSTSKNVRLLHNTIYDTSKDGIALYNLTDPEPDGLIKHNIIANTGVAGVRLSGNQTDLTVDFNCLYNCGIPLVVNIPMYQMGSGNIFNNPMFTAPGRSNFRLLADSPCVDAGDPSASYQYEPDPNGGRVNLGMYGNTPQAARSGEFIPDFEGRTPTEVPVFTRPGENEPMTTYSPDVTVLNRPRESGGTTFPTEMIAELARPIPLNHTLSQLNFVQLLTTPGPDLSATTQNWTSPETIAAAGTVRTVPFSVLVHSFEADTDGLARAKKAVYELNKQSLGAFWTSAMVKGRNWYRVLVGMYASRLEAETVARVIREQQGLSTTILQLPYTINLGWQNSLKGVYAISALADKGGFGVHYWEFVYQGQHWYLMRTSAFGSLSEANTAAARLSRVGLTGRVTQR